MLNKTNKMKTETTNTGWLAELAQEKMNLLGSLGFTYEEALEIVKEAVNTRVADMNRAQMRVV